ncbi:hypothetical protein [Salinibacter ruber]|uniref:hypothetical protein n=1 Tax=Salinibacter ruber TaxID=146919 RepID=UPI002167A500|nr:hypothetical protein [Salinibacter ruber]MCS3822659.1 hypothetical protein [Salinibacter ruber]
MASTAFFGLKQVEEKKEGRHGSVKIRFSQWSLRKGDGFGRAEARDLLPKRFTTEEEARSERYSWNSNFGQ